MATFMRSKGETGDIIRVNSSNTEVTLIYFLLTYSTSISIDLKRFIVFGIKYSGERMRKVVQAISIVLAFVLGAALGFLIPLNSNNIAETSERSELEIGVIVPALQLKVYDSKGFLVKSYTKVGDLPTVNFLKAIMHSWWYYDDSIQLYNGTWTAEDGTSGYPADNYHAAYSGVVGGVTKISLKIVLGNGTTSPTVDDYALESKLAEAPVTYYKFDMNSTHMWIEVKGSFTATDAINITEVGLALLMDNAISTDYEWILLFRDTISQISLDPDETLEVRYYIYVKYA